MDESGVLHYAFSPDKSAPIPYARFLEVDEDGQPAEKAKGMEIEGLSVAARLKSGSGRTLIFVRKAFDLIILSAEISRSDFAKRFLLDQFDSKAYRNPLFALAAAPRKDPLMGRADSVQFLNGGQKVLLGVQGLKIEADLAKRTVKLSGSKQPVPFSFHRRMHDGQTGKMTKFPSVVSKNARYHLIQTNLPAFRGQHTHVVPTASQSLSDIAGIYKMDPSALSSYLGKDEGHEFSKGARITIPGKGYDLIQAWFFMDDEAFRSLLVQGFLMEELDPSLFEKVTSSAWGKVYKILR